MNTKKLILILFCILVVILYFLSLHRIDVRQTKEKVGHFLNTALNITDFPYKEYIHPYYEGNLDLIDFLYDNRNHIEYEIASTKKINSMEYKISVKLHYKDKNIPLHFIVTEHNKEWLISHIPEYKFIPAALFLEEGSSNITVDIQGNNFSYISNYPLSVKKWTPLSLHIIDDYLLYHKILKEHHITKLVRKNHKNIEDIYMGDIPVIENIPIYIRNDRGFYYFEEGTIPIGTQDMSIYSNANGIGQLAMLNSPTLLSDKIRVLINDSSYENKFHYSINIILGTSCTVKEFSSSTPQEFGFTEGEELQFKIVNDSIALYHNGNKLGTSSRRWHIEGNDNNIFYIKNIKRAFSKDSNKGTPYKGDLEISMGIEGLILINEIDIEKYLYSVVTSEMPVAFGLEALKVQALAARAYAVAALNRSGFAAYGAHLDDSTASQMYNNVDENPIAIEAVNSTYGLVPFYNQEIVDTRFFSTSCGYTAAFNEVWSDSEGNFPGIQNPYLQAKPQYTGDSPSLHNEENFRAFIDRVNNTSYDRFSPLFRWSVKFSKSQLEVSIAHNLPRIQREEPRFVLTRVADNKYECNAIPDDIGELLNIVVLTRGQGGNIMELEISTTSGTYRVKKELNIRDIIRPIDYIGGAPIELRCHDGSIREDFPLLPSAFAYIDIERDTDGNITYINIIGGGYGHGVGMSQYGTYGLSLLGKSYIEIIEHYYPGCELKKYIDN